MFPSVEPSHADAPIVTSEAIRCEYLCTRDFCTGFTEKGTCGVAVFADCVGLQRKSDIMRFRDIASDFTGHTKHRFISCLAYGGVLMLNTLGKHVSSRSTPPSTVYIARALAPTYSPARFSGCLRLRGFGCFNIRGQLIKSCRVSQLFDYLVVLKMERFVLTKQRVEVGLVVTKSSTQGGTNAYSYEAGLR